MEVSTFSIDRLIRLAFEHQLLTDYRVTPSLVQLCSGKHTVELDPEAARLHLVRLVSTCLRIENASPHGPEAQGHASAGIKKGVPSVTV